MPTTPPEFLSKCTLATSSLGMTASAIIAFQGGFTFTAICLAAFIILASIGVSRVLYSHQVEIVKSVQKAEKKRIEQQEENVKKLKKMTELCQAIVPLWQGQIDDVIKQSSEAIETLTLRFSEIVQALRKTLEDVELLESGHSGASISDVITDSEAELSTLNSNFELILTSKVKLLSEVTQLQSFANELQTMAIDVQGIAGQTNLLALNAAIEAARAGESGRGFAVVADEVRSLSQRSSDTGQKMTGKVEGICTAMDSAVETTESQLEDERLKSDASHKLIEDVISRLNLLIQSFSDSSGLLKDHSSEISDEINDILISLQFQDRVTQILEHTKDEIARFSLLLNNPDDILNVDTKTWLKEMSQGYTTSSQRNLHANSKAERKSTHIEKDDEIEFF